MNTQNFNPDSRPKVFISYSWDSREHKTRVLQLSARLRGMGVNCYIDRYVEFPSEGWLRWMENQLGWAEFVLVICTEQYRQRFRGLEEAGKGKGATWEGAIIAQELYNEYVKNTKFIPVIFSSQDSKHIPNILSSFSRYVLDTEEGYEKLYRLLTNQHETPITELGHIEPLQPLEPKQDFDKQTQNSEPQNHLASEVGADPTETTEFNNTQQSLPTDKRINKVFIFTVLSVLIVILFVIIFKILHYPASEKQFTDFQFTTKHKTEIITISNPIYKNLEKLLKNGKFEEADQETFNLMRSIAKLKNNQINFDGKNDILTFDCEALHTIDMLWTVNSNNCFGFSIQNQIWIEEGGKPGMYDDTETSDRFASRVGWDVKKKSFFNPIAQYSCQFNEEKKGNLPCKVNLHIFKQGVPYIVERLKSCGD